MMMMMLFFFFIFLPSLPALGTAAWSIQEVRFEDAVENFFKVRVVQHVKKGGHIYCGHSAVCGLLFTVCRDTDPSSRICQRRLFENVLGATFCFQAVGANIWKPVHGIVRRYAWPETYASFELTCLAWIHGNVRLRSKVFHKRLEQRV